MWTLKQGTPDLSPALQVIQIVQQLISQSLKPPMSHGETIAVSVCVHLDIGPGAGSSPRTELERVRASELFLFFNCRGGTFSDFHMQLALYCSMQASTMVFTHSEIAYSA
jgi:hypothetical protein